MKILLVSNMYPSPEAPNYGVFVKNTEEILKGSGIDVDRIVMHKEKNRYIKLLKYLGYYVFIIFKGLSCRYDAIYVHYASHNALPLLALKGIKKDIRIYTNVHGSDVMPKSELSRKLQKYVKQLLYVSYRIITPSSYYKNLVCEKYGADVGKVYVFPSGGINSDVFHRIINKDVVYKGLGLDKNMKYIGYVGRIDYKKGWDVFIEAINLLHSGEFIRDKRFIIVGSGEQDDMLWKMVGSYNLSEYIIRYGMLPQDKLCDIYNCLEVFCFPTRGESLGLVGLEAMACGVPVIGSSVGGLLDYMVDGRNGLLFEPGNSDMLKDKLIEYFSCSEDKRESMRCNALATSDRYMAENIKGELIRIFNQSEK